MFGLLDNLQNIFSKLAFDEVRLNCAVNQLSSFQCSIQCLNTSQRLIRHQPLINSLAVERAHYVCVGVHLSMRCACRLHVHVKER